MELGRRRPCWARSVGGTCPALFLLYIVLTTVPAWAAPYSIDISTPFLSGTSAQLAFDFIDGGPPASDNTITISKFVTDGTLGAVSLSGGVAGTLTGTVTLTDPVFFNEYLTNTTLGTDFSFEVSATTNFPGSPNLPDAFSLSVLDPITGLPLFSTSDPTGANTLMLLNIDGTSNGTLDVYTAPGREAVVTATLVTPSLPEPGTLFLLAYGVVLLLCNRNRFSGNPSRI